VSRGAEVCLPSWLDAPSGKGDSSSKESCQGPGLARCCCRLRRPDCIANACASDRAGSPAAVRGSRESGPQVATMCATEGPGIAGLQGSKVVDQDLQGIATERVRTTSSLRHDSDRFGPSDSSDSLYCESQIAAVSTRAGMSLVLKHSTPRRVHLQGSGQVRATGVPSCDVMPHFEDAMTRADDHIYELELALSVIHAAAAVCGPLLAEARRLY